MKKEQKSAEPAVTAKRIPIQPLGDKVLIKEKKAGEERTKSGIIIPDTVSKDKGSKTGEVMAVGEGRYEDGKIIPVRVKVGDEVLFQWGDSVEIGGEEYQIVGEGSIIGIINN
ncbi:MAG: co-chaperone GroES [Candidatus Paceibacterota bacterium]